MDTKKTMKIYVGFITYNDNTADYLLNFLPSLRDQTYWNMEILAVDNSEEKDNKNNEIIKKFSCVSFTWSGGNIGFAKAFNSMIRLAISGGAKYFLALNPDMILAEDFIEKIVGVAEADGQIGAVAPKILKWDFASNKRTKQLDSLGLEVTKEHRFFDAYQGENDRLGLAISREVFGFTGAAALLRLDALKDIAFDNGGHQEYFDELMFMYKEDCDLSYRLRLAGWKIVLAPEAAAYHDRAVASKGKTNLEIALNRRSKSQQVKKWSFLNQWILLIKFGKLPFSRPIKAATAWYQLKSLLFILIFEPFLIKQLFKLRQIMPEIKKRREQLKIRINAKEIEKFMYDNR